MATFFRRLRARIKYWNNAEELRKELDAHREMAAARFAADGTPERESRWKAARLLGNTTIAREDARAVWVARWLEQLKQDSRYALRTMRREWAFAITASVTLAIGLGVLIGVFTVFNAIFLRPWPVRNATQVFGVSERFAEPMAGDGAGLFSRISYFTWDRIRPAMASADLAVWYDYGATIKTTESGRGRSALLALVNDGFVNTIGLPLQSGSLSSASGLPGMLITDGIWRSAFGADPTIVGRQVWVGSHPAIVTGVLDPKFRGFPPRTYDGLLLLTPETTGWLTTGLTVAPDLMTNPKGCCIQVVGRLRPGFTRAQAAQEIEARVNVVHEQLGLRKLAVVPWKTTMSESRGASSRSRSGLFALLFAGGSIVTLLACANIGNLQLARGLRRSREVAVRLSLGASRRRLVRQFLTESAALSMIAVVGGLAIAWMVPPAVMSFNSTSPIVYTPDAGVIAFAVGCAVLATLLSGLAPALRVTGINWRAAASGVSGGGGRLRGFLLAAQIGLSLSLIASASLLSRGALRAAGGVNAGFEFHDIAAFAFMAPPAASENARNAVTTELKAAFALAPAIAQTDTVPWTNGQPYFMAYTPGRIDGVMAQTAGFNRAGFSMLKIPLVAGRWPNEDARLRESVISRSLARMLWNTEEVIGRVITSKRSPFRDDADYTVVGLIDEIQLRSLAPMPALLTARRDEYLPFVLGPPSSEAEIRTLLSRVDPDFRMLAIPLAGELRKQMQATYLGVSIASGLGLVALLLASLGVFGVFAYIVEERRREIGVRLALGANRWQVRRSIIAATRWPVIGGLAAGLALALIAGFVLRGNLYGLSVLDPLSYLVVAAILGVAAIAATSIPLRRALRVDPAVTLRAD